MMSRLSTIIHRLKLVDTAALCDADKSAGYNAVQVMTNKMQCRSTKVIENEKKMIGVARTVQLSGPEDFLAVLRGLHESQEGEVLCVNTLNSSKAVAGGLFLTEAERKGLQGVIIDGAVRDNISLRRSCIHCYSTSVNPYSGSIVHLGEMQVPITCGGATVTPGDIIIGDADGVIVASIETFENLIHSAETIISTEKSIMDAMKKGQDLHSLTNYDEHVSALKNDKKSALKFTTKI